VKVRQRVRQADAEVKELRMRKQRSGKVGGLEGKEEVSRQEDWKERSKKGGVRVSKEQ